jgi:hypothetical protein
MLTSLTSRLSEAFGGVAIDASKVLTPSSGSQVPPAYEAVVSDAFAGALHRVFWVAVFVAVIGLACTVLMPRGSAAKIRDAARREAELDSLSPEGESFAVTDPAVPETETETEHGTDADAEPGEAASADPALSR